MQSVLVTDPTAAADALAAADAAVLAVRVAALAPPPVLLDGWSSLCATEYARAAVELRALLHQLVEVLRLAERPS